MSWFTDVRNETLSKLGLNSAEGTVNAAGQLVQAAVKQPSPTVEASLGSPVEQAKAVISNASTAVKASGLVNYLPLVLVAGVALYFFIGKKRRS